LEAISFLRPATFRAEESVVKLSEEEAEQEKMLAPENRRTHKKTVYGTKGSIRVDSSHTKSASAGLDIVDANRIFWPFLITINSTIVVTPCTFGRVDAFFNCATEPTQSSDGATPGLSIAPAG
jgi:hypothetical protein